MLASFLHVALGCGFCQATTISFKLVNNCSDQTIWPAMYANAPTDPGLDPLTPGLSLRPGASVQTKPLPLPWGGRIWARQFCSVFGTDCLIGGCPGRSCWPTGGGFALLEKTTLFEIFADETISYDISLGRCSHIARAPYYYCS